MKHSKLEIALLTISVVFVVVMLIVPLVSVLVNSLAEGWEFYIQALTTPYVLSALRLTLLATVVSVIVNTIFGLVLSTNGRDEEEAAALMGASGWTIFFRITLPQIKWALLYGIVLCTARALGEFGAVSALSKLRGETFTLPLEIDALYQSGSADAITAAFAVSSLLVLLAIIVLLLRTFLEAKADKSS